MRRKLLVAVLLVATAFLIQTGIALADNTTAVTPTPVTMQGNVAVVGSSQAPQLRLKTQSANGGDWLLEIALNPERTGYNDSGTRVLNLSGTFTLGTPQLPISTGTATGWIDTNNNGDVTLTAKNSNTSLDVSYTISRDGTVTSQVQGQWPLLPGQQTMPVQPVNHFFWYLSRTAGILAYLLLFVNVCLGLSSKFMGRATESKRFINLHKFSGLLAMAFLSLHVFSLLGDKYFNFNLTQLLLPFAAPYRTFWTSMGVIAFYMVIAVTFSSYLRRFISARSWRVLHILAFILFFVALFHGIMAGTDTPALWNRLLYVTTGTAAVFLVLWRFKDAISNWLATYA